MLNESVRTLKQKQTKCVFPSSDFHCQRCAIVLRLPFSLSVMLCWCTALMELRCFKPDVVCEGRRRVTQVLRQFRLRVLVSLQRDGGNDEKARKHLHGDVTCCPCGRNHCWTALNTLNKTSCSSSLSSLPVLSSFPHSLHYFCLFLFLLPFFSSFHLYLSQMSIVPLFSSSLHLFLPLPSFPTSLLLPFLVPFHVLLSLIVLFRFPSSLLFFPPISAPFLPTFLSSFLLSFPFVFLHSFFPSFSFLPQHNKI